MGRRFGCVESGAFPRITIVSARLAIKPREVLTELGRHVLIDGFKLVLDLEKSRGSRVVDADRGRTLLDLYGCFASMPLGYRHPRFDEPDVKRDLLAAARSKVANSDVYCTLYADFLRTFHYYAGLPPLERYFFIEGGAMAVENALKAAMDWKVRRNLAAGRGERGTEIVHFEGAFHGRSGYTMSLTNTDPLKVAHYAKFSWPRLPAPSLDFSISPEARTRDAAEKERLCEDQLQNIMARQRDDIAAIIIEPIQGEGGDRHFRGEWLRTLRRICDEHDVLLIFDEVQCGGGTTGRMWCCEHFDVRPDLLAFGKKMQACGVMAGPRLDEVRDNVFRLPGRINSTWGGNLVDMVRATHCLQVIHEEHLLEHATRVGATLVKELQRLADEEPVLSAVRGRGFMIAFDLPTTELREEFLRGLFERGLLALRAGPRSIRFRPALDLPEEAVGQAISILKKQCQRMAVPHG
jgi:L-lysine 6-transaminase